MTTDAIQLGDRVRDLITGFEGVVTGRCEYITGCTQVLVAPAAKDGAFVESHWFDVDRCEPAGGKRISLAVSIAGPDKEAPKR